MTYETLKIQIADRRATLALNRPNAANSMNLLMLQELADCLEFFIDNPEVQILVVKGEGNNFSAGGDIKMMLESGNEADFETVMNYISRIALALYQLPMITIAQIKGAAAGLGFSFALGCDIIAAEENSSLAMNYIGIGLIPDGGGHFFVKERLGISKAKEHIWKGSVMNAQEAHQHGLIDYKVEEGELDSFVDQLVGKFLSSPILAILETKKILHAQKLPELTAVLQAEAQGQLKMRKTEDHLEGIKAFIEKRTQQFKGK